MSELPLYIAYTDGAARGNPGPAGAGVIIYGPKHKVIEEAKLYLGETTNNVAEYRALILALDKLDYHNAENILIRADSELMVKQIKGEYRVKNEGLKPLYEQAMGLIEGFDTYKIEHVPREENKAADRLANAAIDEAP